MSRVRVHDEVDLVRIIWASLAYLADLDLVAVLGDQLVGHVLHILATVDGRQVVAPPALVMI